MLMTHSPESSPEKQPENPINPVEPAEAAGPASDPLSRVVSPHGLGLAVDLDFETGDANVSGTTDPSTPSESGAASDAIPVLEGRIGKGVWQWEYIDPSDAEAELGEEPLTTEREIVSNVIETINKYREQYALNRVKETPDQISSNKDAYPIDKIKLNEQNTLADPDGDRYIQRRGRTGRMRDDGYYHAEGGGYVQWVRGAHPEDLGLMPIELKPGDYRATLSGEVTFSPETEAVLRRIKQELADKDAKDGLTENPNETKSPYDKPYSSRYIAQPDELMAQARALRYLKDHSDRYGFTEKLPRVEAEDWPAIPTGALNYVVKDDSTSRYRDLTPGTERDAITTEQAAAFLREQGGRYGFSEMRSRFEGDDLGRIPFEALDYVGDDISTSHYRRYTPRPGEEALGTEEVQAFVGKDGSTYPFASIDDPYKGLRLDHPHDWIANLLNLTNNYRTDETEIVPSAEADDDTQPPAESPEADNA
jgi:hypothetical protein